MSFISRLLRIRRFRFSRPNSIRILFVGLLITTFLMFIGTETAFRKHLKNSEPNPTKVNPPTVKKLLSAEVDYLLQNITLGPISNDQCKHLIHDAFVVDDRGNICAWRDLSLISGCCRKKEGNNDKRFCNDSLSCDRSTHCCQNYHQCISCCLENSKQDLASLVKESPVLGYSNSTFELCTASCRTNSKSVYHENAYRSHYKYCFGTSPPPLIPRINRWLV